MLSMQAEKSSSVQMFWILEKKSNTGKYIRNRFHLMTQSICPEDIFSTCMFNIFYYYYYYYYYT